MTIREGCRVKEYKKRNDVESVCLSICGALGSVTTPGENIVPCVIFRGCCPPSLPNPPPAALDSRGID